jgi:potassium channel subfamily K
MNDPGLDEPISKDAEDIENQHRDEEDEKEEDEQAFLEPRYLCTSFLPSRINLANLDSSRWWFASTAFPLVAGTFGPMASAFSICALVVHWREYLPPGATEDTGIPIPDPPWYSQPPPLYSMPV